MITDMWEKIKNSFFLNVVIAAGAVGAVIGLFGIARDILALQEEYTAAYAKIEAVRREKVRLLARIRELETPEAMEREAKEKLNLKKKGETIVVVVPERQLLRTTSSSVTGWQEIRSFFARMFGQVEPPAFLRR